MVEKLLKVKQRYDEITALLSDPAVLSNQDRFRELSREHSQLTPVVQAFDRYQKARAELEGLKEIADTSGDPEMRQLAYAEMDDAKQRVATLEEELKVLLIPRDPDDSRNVIVEIRAGTGGDEAALFAVDLVPHVLPLCGEARMEGRGARYLRFRHGRHEGDLVLAGGRRCLWHDRNSRAVSTACSVPET